jgi:hypothetical protein
MSRSIKKEPVYKDPNNKKGKVNANRKLRRLIKKVISSGKETMPMLEEVMNTYDIVDFKIKGYNLDRESSDKLKRK